MFVAYLEEYQRTEDYRGAIVLEQYQALLEKMAAQIEEDDDAT